MAGTGNHAGASPSRSEWHRQDRVGCIVECDQPKGEQKGLTPCTLANYLKTTASIGAESAIEPLSS